MSNSVNDDINFVVDQLKDEPSINVFTNDQFEERVAKVFKILNESLSKSFGPGGAGTFISVYPNYYNSKDGFTIMKNVCFSKKIDQVISDIAMSICNRLNFTVGDGTTTAIIATNKTYDMYLRYKPFFSENYVLPRTVISKYNILKNMILKKISQKSIPIRSDNPKELRKNIEKVVYVSSNGNEDITKMIGELYEELMHPAISCKLSNDGTTKASIIEGYKLDISLTDKLYINNDNGSLFLDASDFIVFDHRVTKSTYEYILSVLAAMSRDRGRHLVCIAPYYDETALSSVIKLDLLREYNRTKDISLILTVCTKSTAKSKTLLNDLAMLLNTPVITSQMEEDIISKMKTNDISCYNIFGIDNRNIPKSVVYFKNPSCDGFGYYNEESEGVFQMDPKFNTTVRLGYCEKSEIGIKDSVFSGFYYNTDMYDRYMKEAQTNLSEIRRKCEKVGVFSQELINCQERVYSLSLKTGLIEVGSTSDISQGYLKDAVDDAVRAAASAYNNGVILGCNVSLIQSMKEIFSETDKDNNIDRTLLSILINGFREVYKTVLSNMFNDIQFSKNKNKLSTVQSNINEETNESLEDTITNKDDIENIYSEVTDFMHKIGYNEFSFGNVDNFIDLFLNKIRYTPISIQDAIILYSIETNQVFDISTGRFTRDVINSSETDKEILKAIIDLLSLLITGNQLVLR